MVVTALILLVTKIPVWWFAISVVTIICREISVSALRDWMAQKGHNVTIEVSKLGKIKTAMQMISIVILLEASPGANILQFDILSYSPVPKPVTFLIGLLLFFASTILTVFSGMQYLIASWPFLVAPNV
jgi:phosphatidylglycerophosphate synthase